MCGRFTITKTKDDVFRFLYRHFDLKDVQDFDLPRYNIGPGQDIIALLYDGQNYRVGNIPWDYRIKTNGKLKQMINARAETVDERYSFKHAFKSRRCIILADGFYEWDQITKQPYRIFKKEEELYFYAGIYGSYMKDGNQSFGALILTTKANSLIEEHHSRMPVILDVERAKKYLDPSLDLDEVKLLLSSYPSDLMAFYPVSKQVNSTHNDDINLIKKTTIN
jgi:putative SOS response-associated peptidase YedK